MSLPSKLTDFNLAEARDAVSGKKVSSTELTKAFSKAVADAKGKIKDIDTLKASVGPIGKACGDCHQTFRVKNS